MTPGQRKTMCRELAFIAALVWLFGWLMVNSTADAIANLFAGAGIFALYRMGS